MEKMSKRDHCDDNCVKINKRLEKTCTEDAKSLTKIFEHTAAKTEAQKRCSTDYCKPFPNVMFKETEAEMKSEVKAHCTNRCTESYIKKGCGVSWGLNIGTVTRETASECTEKSTLSKCMKNNTAAADTAFKTCQDTTKTTCETEQKACNTKGKTDKTFKDAKAFCTSRYKQCREQAHKKCYDANTKAVDKGEADCQAKEKVEMAACKKDTLENKRVAGEKACIAKKTPTCMADCGKLCLVDNMRKCLGNLESEGLTAEGMCKDLWYIMHNAAEANAVTGDPIPPHTSGHLEVEEMQS